MMYLKKNAVFFLLIVFSYHITSQSLKDEQVVVGMPIKSVCNNYSLKISDRYDDPCHGYVQHNEEKKLIMLWNRDETIFLIFNNVPSSAFNRRGRLNFKKLGDDSRLLLITSSGKEGLFFMNNIID